MGLMAIDYTTPEGQVRLLIPDTDEDNQLFPDDAIKAYLSLYDDNIKRAAASALDAVASSTVMLLKYVKTDDLTVDGPAVGKELRLRARALREEADADDLEDAMNEGFQIVNPVYVPDVWEDNLWL